MEEILRQILEELRFHGKLLSEMTMQIDERQNKQAETKKEIQKKIQEAAGLMGESPLANILKMTAEQIGGIPKR